jgi:hypothetical protein
LVAGLKTEAPEHLSRSLRPRTTEPAEELLRSVRGNACTNNSASKQQSGIMRHVFMFHTSTVLVARVARNTHKKAAHRNRSSTLNISDERPQA